MEIKKASSLDASSLSSIHNACFSENWSEDSFKERMTDGSIWTFFILKDKKEIGYLSAYTIVDEASIVNIAVLDEYRKKGYGSAILEKFITYCKETNVAKIMLEVRESNIGAIKLYQKYGFCEVGKSPKHYSNPVEDAILMNKLL